VIPLNARKTRILADILNLLPIAKTQTSQPIDVVFYFQKNDKKNREDGHLDGHLDGHIKVFFCGLKFFNSQKTYIKIHFCTRTKC